MAAVGPYIQSSTLPRGGSGRHELLVKPAYPDGTSTLPTHDQQGKQQGKAGTGERAWDMLAFKDQTTISRFLISIRNSLLTQKWENYLFLGSKPHTVNKKKRKEKDVQLDCSVGVRVVTIDIYTGTYLNL